MYSLVPSRCRRSPVSALPLLPEVLLSPAPPEQRPLELLSEGVLRYVWESAYGPMLIEVRDGHAFVNGSRVLPMSELRGAEEGGDRTGR